MDVRDDPELDKSSLKTESEQSQGRFIADIDRLYLYLLLMADFIKQTRADLTG